MSEQERYEKDEKGNEKHEEKYSHDPLGTMVWAVILIWAGLVFLADNLGWLEGITMGGWASWLPEGIPFVRPNVWSLILTGAGVIILFEVAVRLLVPSYRRPIFGSLIFAAILLSWGLGGVFNWTLIWPVVLIAIGLSLIFGGRRRRE